MSGFSTKTAGPKLPSMPSIGSKAKGYGKVGSQDDSIEMMPAIDTDGGAIASGRLRAPADEKILGGDVEGGVGHSAALPEQGRHRKKKCCLALCLVLLLAAAAAAAYALHAGLPLGIVRAARRPSRLPPTRGTGRPNGGS